MREVRKYKNQPVTRGGPFTNPTVIRFNGCGNLRWNASHSPNLDHGWNESKNAKMDYEAGGKEMQMGTEKAWWKFTVEH